MPTLVLPHERYKESFLEAVREFHAEERYLDVNPDELEKDFAPLLEKFDDDRAGRNLPEYWVPNTVYWLVEENHFIGRASVRHTLTPALKGYGGHIGYTIRPTERQKGYGMLALQLVLPKVKGLGINRALITCDATNIASIKIIERNGGEYIDQTVIEGRSDRTCRYWIKT